MTMLPGTADAVVIGGGFYGTVLAVYLAQKQEIGKVVLVEQERRLLSRASYNNQARVHNGYHYPRSFTTAFRSRVNLPRFVQDWPQAVTRDFAKLYAIARRNSRVNARQFRRFCDEIGARLLPADPSLRSLFDSRLVEEVFLVEEYAFDASKLAAWADTELRKSGVDVRLETRALAISKTSSNGLLVTMSRGDDSRTSINTRYVFNCAYSGLNHFGGEFSCTKTALKHEVAEMALLQLPPPLKGLGITVMDGPFFSLMPFPDRGLHTLSHVRYTPHLSWADSSDIDAYQRLRAYKRVSRYDRMVRDAARYLPLIAEAQYADSLFEIKTVLVKNEVDDGRPILFEEHSDLHGFYSILGGKIDNIYDVLEKLEHEIT